MTNAPCASVAGPLLPGEPAVCYVVGATIQAALGGAIYTIPGQPLTGAELLTHCGRYPTEFPTKPDLAAASGHIKPGGRIDFISFYEALLAAKNAADPNYHVTVDSASDEELEYDELSLGMQALYDSVHERFGDKWNHGEVMEFMQLLDDIGITTAEQLDDSFYGMSDGLWDWEARFAEEFVNSMEYGLIESMAYSAIDWQKVWDHQLSYDFAAIEFDGDAYIFACR